jgi:hypothetical protein
LKKRIAQFRRSHHQLVQQSFPIGWNSPRGPRYGLIFWMRMRGKQLRTLNRPLLLVIEEPILTRLEAGNDRMPGFRCMLRGVLARRTVAATNVPTLRTSTEVKPPTFR